MKKALLYLFTFIIIQIVVTGVVMGLWRLIGGSMPEQTNGVMIVVTSIAYSIVVATTFFYMRWTPLNGRYISSRPRMVILWSVLAGVGLLLPSVWLEEQMPEMPNLLEDTLAGLITTPGGYLAVGILAPLAEEIVFRGAILRVLLEKFQGVDNTRRAWGAIALSALFFALVHANPAQMPHAFLVGLLLGWMYWRTGSIIPGTIVHIVNNTGAYLCYRLYPNADTLSEVLGDDVTVLKAVLSSLLILLPSLYQLHVWMKRVR